MSRAFTRLLPATVGGRLGAVLVPAIVVLLAAVATLRLGSQRQHSQADEAAESYEAASLSQQIVIDWLQADALTGQYFNSTTLETRNAVQDKAEEFRLNLLRLREIEAALGATADLAQVDSAIAQAAIH